MLTLDEDYMNGFKVIVDAIWKEKENIQEGGLKLKEKRIKEIDKEISDKVEKITAVDMFPQTSHTECVCILVHIRI